MFARRFLLVALLTALGCDNRGARHGLTLGHQSQAVTAQCPGSNTLPGMDVSDYDSIDWRTAARDGGIVFGIARISDGLNYPDTQFAYNWAGMLDAGVIRGAYQFFESTQDATAQANMVVNAVGMLGPNDLPVAFDMESGDPPTSEIQTWLNIVQAGTGKVPIIYTGWGYWDGLGYGTTFSALPLWLANYDVTCPGLPYGWNTYFIWQWTGNGTVVGNTSVGNSDVDIFNGTYDQLLAFAQGSSASCSPWAGTCAVDGDCCTSLFCDAGSCEYAGACQPMWNVCVSAAQCCSGLTCLTWTPSGQTAGTYCCEGVGATCNSGRQCCGGSLCNNGVCACVPAHTYCQNDEDCCSGLSCQSGTCETAPATSSSSSGSSSSSSFSSSTTSSSGHTSTGTTSSSATSSTGNSASTSTGATGGSGSGGHSSSGATTGGLTAATATATASTSTTGSNSSTKSGGCSCSANTGSDFAITLALALLFIGRRTNFLSRRVPRAFQRSSLSRCD